MAESQQNPDIKALQALILKWLEDNLDQDAYSKLNSAFQNILDGAEDWEVYSSFSGVPKYTGKKNVSLTEDDIKSAAKLRRGWKPELWQIDQLGRTLLLLAVAERPKEEFLDKLEKIFITSDMGEAEALYQSLPIMPYPKELTQRAAEGVRSNITSVFDAVAHHNPYPADFMDDDAFNQIVLKALFVGSPLYKIQGLDKRANQKLAKILIEYAHERWSAGRVISPELWRPVGPFIDENTIDEMKKVLSEKDDIHKHAAFLALKASDSEAAGKLLDQNSDILKSAEEKKVTWEEIGKEWEKVNE
jgi:hypothetical protein